MTLNQAGEIIVSENDVVNELYRGNPVVSTLTVDDSSWIEQYNRTMRLFDLSVNELEWHSESKLSQREFCDSCVGIDGWYMPAEYKNMNIIDYLTEKCTTTEQINRVAEEFVEYERRNMIPVLKFLVYFIDTLEKNNVVWGVGRGSSVASYILYLLKVHRIDSLKHKLDIKEFLK